MAKYLAAEAAWEAGNACIDATAATASPRSTTSSGSSASAASTGRRPINNNLVLAYVGEHVLGMPRSY